MLKQAPENVSKTPLNQDNNPPKQNKKTKPSPSKKKKPSIVSKLTQQDFIDDDFPSDSDSDPMFSLNASAKSRAQTAQNTSCWDGIVSIFSSCFSQKQSTLEIDGEKYKIKKLIAEGGFSFVYLGAPANKTQSIYSEFAIKKMNIQTKEQMKAARWEIEVMQQLHIQHSDSLKNKDIKGNEEEKHELIQRSMSEIERKYKGDNNYIVPLTAHTTTNHQTIPEFKIVYMVFPFFDRGNLVNVLQRMWDANRQFMEEERLLTIFIKICYGVFELHKHSPSWAHRDIKLDNILLGADDEPYLMDFGSVSAAKIQIRSRNDAVEIQEWAQKNMSGPYTSPEFFNCPSKFKFDERTDVWALGCLLYAMGFGRSPFDNELSGGSAALAVLSKVEYPSVHPYSDDYIALIEWMLKVKLKHRPFVPAVIQRVCDMLNDTKAKKKVVPVVNKVKKKD